MKKQRLTKQTFRDIRNFAHSTYLSLLWFKEEPLSAGHITVLFGVIMILPAILLDDWIFPEPFIYGERARIIRVLMLTTVLYIVVARVLAGFRWIHRFIREWYTKLPDSDEEESTEKVKREMRLADGERAEIIYDEEPQRDTFQIL